MSLKITGPSQAALSATYASLQSGLAPSPRRPPQIGKGGRKVLTSNPGADGWTFGTSNDATANISATGGVTGGTYTKMVSKGTGAATNLTKTGLTAMDFTTNDLEVLIRIPDKTHLKQTTYSTDMYLGTGGFAGYFLAQLRRETESQVFLPGEWYRLRFACPGTASAGSPARNAITDLQFQFMDDNTGNKVEVHVQEVSMVPKSAAFGGKTVVCFDFDDGWLSQWTNAVPKLAQYGFPGSFAPILDTLGDANHLGLTHLRAMRDLYGHKIVAHAATTAHHNLPNGLGDLSTADLEVELATMVKFQVENGFSRDMLYYPRGGFTTASVEQTRRYFSFARAFAGTPLDTLAPQDPMRIRCVPVGSPANTLAQLQGLVDTAIGQQSMIVFGTHEVTNSPLSGSYVDLTTFNGLVDYVATKVTAGQVTVMALQDAMAAF